MILTPLNPPPPPPPLYKVKLGFTGYIYIIFLISAQKHRLLVLVMQVTRLHMYPQQRPVRPLEDALDPCLPTQCTENTDQTARMRRPDRTLRCASMQSCRECCDPAQMVKPLRRLIGLFLLVVSLFFFSKI